MNDARNDYPKLDRNTRGPSHQGETSRQAQEALNEIDRLRLENEQLRNGIQVRLIAERVVRTLLAEALPVVLTAVERSTPAHADDREWTRTVAVPMAQRALAASIALDKAELTEHERWIFR